MFLRFFDAFLRTVDNSKILFAIYGAIGGILLATSHEDLNNPATIAKLSTLLAIAGYYFGSWDPQANQNMAQNLAPAPIAPAAPAAAVPPFAAAAQNRNNDDDFVGFYEDEGLSLRN